MRVLYACFIFPYIPQRHQLHTNYSRLTPGKPVVVPRVLLILLQMRDTHNRVYIETRSSRLAQPIDKPYAVQMFSL